MNIPIKIMFLTLAINLIFSSTALSDNNIFTVEKVQDGDTLLLNDGTRIRLIGVDTPELHHPAKPVQYFAEEAYKFTKNMAEGRKVKLAFDWQRIDKYDRTLAYVYLLNGKMINAEIIKQGYGFAYTKYPFKYIDEFRSYENEARGKEIGLWSGGGQKELKWLLDREIKPIVLYPMAGNYWAIEYDGFYLPRVSTEAISNITESIKYISYELIEKDLRDELIKEGWIKSSTKEKVK
jgi:micrococcal nuclease